MVKNTSTGSILKCAAFKARLIFNICHIQSYMYEASAGQKMSLIGEYPCSSVTAPTYLPFLTTSCSTLITIVAFLGNFLVILAVFLNPNKDLRSPFNYLVVNLSLADLIVGLITAPLGIAFHFFEGFGIPNQPLRKTMHVSFFISCTASLLSLSALALDRYVAITYPLFYRSKLNAKRSLLVSAGVQTLSVLLSMIYFAVGYEKFRFVFANTAVVVTFQVLLFTNSKIFKFLRAQVRQWDMHACMRRLRSISVNLHQISTSSAEGTSDTATAEVQNELILVD